MASYLSYDTNAISYFNIYSRGILFLHKHKICFSHGDVFFPVDVIERN
jgi:hypothetical protein